MYGLLLEIVLSVCQLIPQYGLLPCLLDLFVLILAHVYYYYYFWKLVSGLGYTGPLKKQTQFVGPDSRQLLGDNIPVGSVSV